MHKLHLIFFVSLTIFSFSINAEATDPEPGMSRRGFLGGLIASAGAAAAAPSALAAGASSSASTAIPASVMRRLAQLRISSLGNVDSGLELYIEKLTEIMNKTGSARLKKILGARIQKARESLSVYQQINTKAKGDTNPRSTTKHASTENSPQTNKQDRINNLHQENQARIKSLGDMQSIPPDIRVLLIRGLLDLDLMNRMAWQAHYGVENKILNSADVRLLEEYKTMLLQTLESSSNSSLAAVLIPKLVTEVDFVLESTALWHKRKNRSFSCKKII